MSNLYIVSTPIGNLQDITLRASDILLSSPVIIAESSSKAETLLNFLENTFNRKRVVDQKVLSLTEEEEEIKMFSVLKILENENAALISEAGTPLISDPGFKLVREAVKMGINIIPIPGPTAVISAISASGLPTDKFFFAGFPPKKSGKRNTFLDALSSVKKEVNSTIILYESPHRIIETLKSVRDIFGNIDIVVARELTKLHEEIRREKIEDSIVHFENTSPKGEFVVLF